MELPGGPFVTMNGTAMMLLSSADNLGSSLKVGHINVLANTVAGTITGMLLR